MKAIRYLSAAPLLLLCILNLYIGIIAIPEPGFVWFIVFGILFFTLGALVISKIRFAPWISFLVPFAILFIYPLIVDFKELTPWSSGIMGAFDAIVVICALIILLNKIK
jgi:hypothetical protein